MSFISNALCVLRAFLLGLHHPGPTDPFWQLCPVGAESCGRTFVSLCKEQEEG